MLEFSLETDLDKIMSLAHHLALSKMVGTFYDFAYIKQAYYSFELAYDLPRWLTLVSDKKCYFYDSDLFTRKEIFDIARGKSYQIPIQARSSDLVSVIFTLGYEGISLEKYINILLEQGYTSVCIIDG